MTPVPDPLDPQDLERLLARAERDPEASRELDFLADLAAAAELERARLAGAPRAPRRQRTWILAAAAALLFVLGAALWYLERAEPAAQRLAGGAPPRYLATELRAPGEPDALGFETAMEPYQRAEWANAMRALEQCLQRAPDHGPTHFYLAAACEQLGELALAEEHYQRAAAVPDPLLAGHARLRLAGLWLARGELERGRAELLGLAEEGGELAANARELLESLGTR